MKWSFVQRPNHLAVSSVNGDQQHHRVARRTPTRRRHSSVGPLQLARAAKECVFFFFVQLLHSIEELPKLLLDKLERFRGILRK
ncbi:unnamed protein product [Gongylonema pulchrum]|uniref:Uncharacterized protein n=1 Tax=Gongylonema pulchrum TaxID=637853 RepID=A0A183E133_9BILA|nr:unnamed protein product [Gongylonema pulchrum]